METAKEMRASMNEAKKVIGQFVEEGGAAFETLSDELKDALKRVGKKAASASPKKSIQGWLLSIFPEDGTVIDEFDLFRMPERLGRSQMQKKVNHAFKTVAPEERLWIRFDPDEGEGSWVRDAQGVEMPDNWDESMLPRTRK